MIPISTSSLTGDDLASQMEWLEWSDYQWERWNGSGVWKECYWCGYRVEDPFILESIGHSLCDLCVDWHLGEGRFNLQGRFERDAAQLGREHWRGGPYEPCATTRCMSLLPRLRPLGNSDERQALVNDLALPENLYVLITSFCCAWHEP